VLQWAAATPDVPSACQARAFPAELRRRLAAMAPERPGRGLLPHEELECRGFEDDSLSDPGDEGQAAGRHRACLRPGMLAVVVMIAVCAGSVGRCGLDIACRDTATEGDSRAEAPVTPISLADTGKDGKVGGSARIIAAMGLANFSQADSQEAESAPPGFGDDVYVELKRDPMAGGFLKQDSNGSWSVWPRKGGQSFQGFLGYGYQRVRAAGGSVAVDIDPDEWEVVPFPVARTGPSGSSDSFTTWGHRYHRGDYTDLVGKTFRFTISGLGGLGCGCNANFYAVALGAGCDGSGSRPAVCEEIDFFEGNKYGWHSTIHALADNGKPDHNGLCTGYGGTMPTAPNFPSFDGTEYGPAGTMIDTEKAFHVAVSFPTKTDGSLKGMCVELSQEGMPSMEQPLFMHLYAYRGSNYTDPGAGGGTVVERGMQKIEKRLRAGVTMLSSLWGPWGMSWLDGAASEHGPNNIMDGKCTTDMVGSCSQYTISGIAVENIKVAHLAQERRLDRGVAALRPASIGQAFRA